MQIAKDITSGRLKLPELNVHHNEEYEAIWALVDSGSSVHVVDADKIFPGAKVNAPEKGSTGFKTANGGRVVDKGTVDIEVVTEEGAEKVTRWVNAEVAMPILSTKLLAKNNGEVRCREEGGEIVNLVTGDTTSFISANGVYFLKLYVHKSITLPRGYRPEDGPQDWSSGKPEPLGFARQG